MKILVLCHGNLCRSPACEAVLKTEGFDVSSAGFCQPGLKASRKVRRVMADLGYTNMDDHRSRMVNLEMVLDPELDLIVLMDNGNRRRLQHLWENSSIEHRPRVAMLAEEIGEKRIEDPAFMRADSKELVATIQKIVEASRRLAERLR